MCQDIDDVRRLERRESGQRTNGDKQDLPFHPVSDESSELHTNRIVRCLI
jgi:hypothetical protein